MRGFRHPSRLSRLPLRLAFHAVHQIAKNGDARRGKASDHQRLDRSFEYGATIFVPGYGKRIGWQLIVRNRLHASESIEQNHLAGMIGISYVLGVIHGRGFGGETLAMSFQVDDIPRVLFAWDHISRAPV